MKAKLALLSLLALTAGLAVPSAQAEGIFTGSFNITGYLEPGLGSPYTWCFDFTTTSGHVPGYPVSGTWNVPSYSDGWTGDWYQVGDEVLLYGVADGTFFFSWSGRLLNPSRFSGRQVEFLSSGATDTEGTFLGVKNSGSCPASDGTARSGDPSK